MRQLSRKSTVWWQKFANSAENVQYGDTFLHKNIIISQVINYSEHEYVGF